MTVQIVNIKVNAIAVLEGRRSIDHAKVSELVESVKSIGLLHPITIDKNNILVAGLHRLEAFKRLGFDEIECVVLDCNALHIELAGIDENLVRHNLDPIQMGELANRRDEILDALGLRANQSNKGKSTGAETAPVKTTADIAKEIGTTERVLQENKQLARNLVQEAKRAVQEKEIPKKDALEISRLEPKQQREVIAKGDKKAIVAAVKKIHTKVREKKENATKHEDNATQSCKQPDGLYSVIIIDPNSDMYDSEEELFALKIPAATDCHLWLWARHKHLPFALSVIEGWGFKYDSTFVWHKTGIDAVRGLHRNCEFAVYARRGNPQFDCEAEFPMCFVAPSIGDQEKPLEFYRDIRLATGGARLIMFDNRNIDGFDTDCGKNTGE